MEINEQFRSAVGEIVYNHLLKLRSVRPTSLKFNGEAISYERPAFLETAILLRDCFNAEAWKEDACIVALTQQAVLDLAREIEAHGNRDDSDAEYISELAVLRNYLQHWLRS